MFGKYFYNKNIRNIVILFGTLFNDITIRRTKSDGTIQNTLKVPIAYGPAKKYLTRLEQGPPNNNTDEKIGMVLPRMSFEIITMVYDPTRKLQKTKRVETLKKETVPKSDKHSIATNDNPATIAGRAEGSIILKKLSFAIENFM